MERNNTYEIEARVELPVLRGESQQTAQMQDIIVNVNPEGSPSRLFGVLLDTLGGTYRLELDNCRLLSVAEQDNMEFDDDCDGISIPSVVVPLATAAEIVGGLQIDEDGYDMKALLSIIEQYKFSFMNIVAGGSMFVQSGSLLTFCVEPLDGSAQCTLRFVKTAENGRTYNMKRYPYETTAEEYDVSGGGEYLLRIGEELPYGTEVFVTVDGTEFHPDAEGVVEGHSVPADSVVVMTVRRRRVPLIFGRHNDSGLVRHMTAPLTADLVRFINNGGDELETFRQTNGYNASLPPIDRLRLRPADFNGDGIAQSVRLLADVSDFAIDGECGNVELELHGIDPDGGDDCTIQAQSGGGADLTMRGEFARRMTLGGEFSDIDIELSRTYDGTRFEFDGITSDSFRFVAGDDRQLMEDAGFAVNNAFDLEVECLYTGLGIKGNPSDIRAVVSQWQSGFLSFEDFPVAERIHFELPGFNSCHLDTIRAHSDIYHLHLQTPEKEDGAYKTFLKEVLVGSGTTTWQDLCHLRLSRCQDGDSWWESIVEYFIQAVAGSAGSARTCGERLLDFSDMEDTGDFHDAASVRSSDAYTAALALSSVETPNSDSSPSDCWTIRFPYGITLYNGQEI